MRRSARQRQVKAYDVSEVVKPLMKSTVKTREIPTRKKIQDPAVLICRQSSGSKAVVTEDSSEDPPAKRFRTGRLIPKELSLRNPAKGLDIKSGNPRTQSVPIARKPPATDLEKSKAAAEVKAISLSARTNAVSNPVDLSDDSSKENIYASDPESDQSDSFNYLKIREQNIRANEDFFTRLGLNTAKEILVQSVAKKKVQPSQRGLKVNKEPVDSLHRRYSLRIRRMDPAGNHLPEEETAPAILEESRLPPGPVLMKDCSYSKNEEPWEESMKFISSMICCQKPGKFQVLHSMKTFKASLEKVTITENRVAKVVPGRVFSVTWYPSPHLLIAVAGDKNGHIGLWDVTSSETSSQDIVRAFRPHIRPVSDLLFPQSAPNKLFSSSYDGTLRCGDFEKEVFNEVFSVPEENDDFFRNFSFIDSPHTMLVSHFSGNVSLVDIRTPSTSAEHVYQISKKSLRTVSVHPTQSQYFIAAGVDTKITLWDLRFLTQKSPKPIQMLELHTKAISSAYFSPTGHKVLSCAADDTILVYSVDKGMKLEITKRIRHNNYTGRWLTKFQPTWHPSVEDVFISGSMQRPRQIEVYGADGALLKALTDDECLGSVCSLNVFHPYLACTLVGANSSGRLHVFM